MCDDPSHHRKGFVLKETQERQKEEQNKKPLGESREGRGGAGLGYVTVLTKSCILFTYIQQYIYPQMLLHSQGYFK